MDALSKNDSGNALAVRITLAEVLGAEVVAHFPLTVEAATTVSAVAEAPALEQAEAGSALLTARLSPRSKARSGQPLRIVTERLHFFDPGTEDSIW